jgi:hypothetical protein
VPATAATGDVVLSALPGVCYAAGCSTEVAQGTEFATSGSPSLIFAVTADTAVVVPPGGAASNSVPVVAQTGGTAGNVPKDTITAWVCAQTNAECQQDEGAIAVSNPAPTTGGVDATTETVASTADIANWQEEIGQYEEQLGNQAQSDLQIKAAGERAAIDPGGNGKSITYTISPSSFPPATAGTVMSAETVTVTMNAAETVYNPASIQADVLADLKASTNLPSGDSLVPGQLSLKNLQVIEAGSDGTFAASVSGVDYYRPAVSLGQLRNQLTWHNPGDVSGIVKQQIPDVQSVSVSESPLKLFFMPFSSSRIQIVETFEARAPASSSSSSTG